MILDTNQISALVELLLVCKPMQTHDQFCQVIRNIDPKVTTTSTYNFKIREDLENLTKRSCQIPGAIENLVRAVVDFETDPGNVKKIWKDLPDALGFEKSIPQNEISNLLKTKIPPELLERSRRFLPECIPENLLNRDDTPPEPDWWEILRMLCNTAPKPGKEIPLLTFLEKLNHLQPKKKQSKLAGWIGRLKEKIQPPAPGPEKAASTLIITLSPVSPSSPEFSDTTEFIARVYLAGDRASEKPVHKFSGKIGKLGEKLDKWLYQQGRMNGPRPRRIVFYLPFKWVFLLEPSNWEIKLGRPVPETFGRNFRMVNSLNRRKIWYENNWVDVSRDLKYRWKDEWKHLKEKTCSCEKCPETGEMQDGLPGCCRLVVPTELNGLNRAVENIGGNPRPVLLAGFNPGKNVREAEHLALAMIQEGIPAAVFGARPDEYPKILKDKNIRNLPEALYPNPNRHKGKVPCSLVWDDPKLEPPDEPIEKSYENRDRLL